MRTFVSATLSFAAVLTLGTPPVGAPAAGPGLGYDQVMKIHASQGSDAPPAPGSFQADFSAASTPPQSSGHGMFGKMIAAAQNMGNMMKVGTAERHYYGTTKFRTDNLGLATGDITDCTARTLTHLDLNAKTYHVTSLDQPQTQTGSGGGSRSGAPGPAATDDGTKIAIDIATHVIGPMTIEGLPTTGYAMDMKMTITKANGETSTSNQAITSYYAAMTEPHAGCPEAFASMPQGPGGPGRGGPSMAQMMLAMQAISGKGDSRFKITSSGPPLPSGKLAMWQMMSMKGETGNAAFSVVTERGDVHPLSDGDPAFSPPPDFTKV